MKKKLLIGTAIAVFGVIGAQVSSAIDKEKAMKLTQYDEAKGFEGPADYFTGEVKVEEPFKSGSNFEDYQGAMVHFKPGARTAWHTHPKGQTLYIVSGEGRAQTEGEAVRRLMPGDVVWFPAHEKHWHGAAPDSKMSHLAIQSPDEDGEVVTWLEQVADKDYTAEPQ